MKLIVTTTGSFSLMDFTQKVDINKGKPTVVKSTHFIQERLGMGHLKLLAQISDDATQEEMLAYLTDSEGDVELAVAAYLSKFDEPTPAAAPKAKARR